MCWRPCKTALSRVVRQVAGAGHAAEPLAHVALVQPHARGQFLARRLTTRREVPEKAQAVAHAGQRGVRQAGQITEDLTEEGLRLLLLYDDVRRLLCLCRHGRLPCVNWRAATGAERRLPEKRRRVIVAHTEFLCEPHATHHIWSREHDTESKARDR